MGGGRKYIVQTPAQVQYKYGHIMIIIVELRVHNVALYNHPTWPHTVLCRVHGEFSHFTNFPPLATSARKSFSLLCPNSDILEFCDSNGIFMKFLLSQVTP